jgi:enolase
MVLIVVRHGQSLWNSLNKFTGFVDIDLSENGINEAKKVGKFLKDYNFDYCYTSDLKRAINTAKIIKKELNQNYDILEFSELKERDYGNLTGKNKDEIKKEYGEEQLKKWRRSYYERPPNGENLDDVVIRVGKCFDENIKEHINNNKNILIIAHGNSLRALMVHLGKKNINNIENLEIDTAVPINIDHNYYKLKGRQILDSRGFPTLEVDCLVNNKLFSRGSTPSGASCGSTEAIELRDNNKNLYLGKSIFNTINIIDNIINKNLIINDENIIDIKNLDNQLILLDKNNTNNNFKNYLGGNTTTAISFCLAKAGANKLNIQLYEYIKKIYNNNLEKYLLPTPLVNIINGGKHAGGKLKIQEFMILPNENFNFEKKIQIICEVYYNLQKLIVKKYGVSSKNIGDEGGFAPNINSPDEALSLIENAIKVANYIPGEDVYLALDCAASEFYNEDTQLYEIEEDLFINGEKLVEYYSNLIENHPSIKSIEDPFFEKDYNNWIKFTNKFSDKIMIVGDDLFTTNPELVKKGLKNNWSNSLLLKVNQIGTITEAIEAAQLMFDKNNNVIVSHRSGETNHNYLIDIAIGIGAKYVKIGAPARGERVSKFNRLIEINELIN